MKSKRVFEVFLGILTAFGGFVDMGDLVANSEAGARFGMGLAWMVLVAYQPETLRLASVGAEVVLVVLLLLAALLLVSVLALLHTALDPD